MNIVVTGATSFLGSALVGRLLAEGHRVYAVIRPGSANRGALMEGKSGLSVIALDLQDLDRIAEVIREECYAFVHFGWGGSGSASRTQEELQRQNVEAAVKALEGAKRLNCRRFLFAGSQAEYGMCREIMREEQTCHPLSAYGQAKAEVYQKLAAQCRAWKKEGCADIEYLHVRIFSVYGPGDHPWTLVESCLDTFLRGGHMELSPCTQMWNFLYLDDFTEGMARLLLHPKRLVEDGLYNLAGDEAQTRPLREYVEMMYRLCRERGSFAYGKRPPNAEGPINLIPSILRMERDLDWHPRVSFEEGIQRIIDKKEKEHEDKNH